MATTAYVSLIDRRVAPRKVTPTLQADLAERRRKRISTASAVMVQYANSQV